MNPDLDPLVEAARGGDWAPLLDASSRAPGKHWAENARCFGKDIGIFMPLSDGPRQDPEHVRLAHGTTLNRPLNLCSECPLATAARCLIESLRHDDEFGIRGGLLACERTGLRAKWHARTSGNVVATALRGEVVELTAGERREVIAHFAYARGLDPAAVARGLGVSRKYLAKLAYRHRVRTEMTADRSSAANGT